MDKVTCLVTIHGIGFQQAPTPELPGYADRLHQNLLMSLPQTLGGDTDPRDGRTNDSGPIYVHSHWPPDTSNTEGGLKRLGEWAKGDDKNHRLIDPSSAPLIDRDRPISHVALIYSHLEDQGPHFGASLETLEKAFFSQSHYTSFLNAVRMSIVDFGALLIHQQPNTGSKTPSLQVREDAKENQSQKSRQKSGDPTGSLFSIIEQLDHDVSTYICRNDLRERVRSFVHEAILRLCCREDVAQIIINSHSQGTVVAYDILRQLPPFAAEKVKVLITAGSPLRKYAALFYWGTDAGCLFQIDWKNFWDEKDPVADPLAPPPGWRWGDVVPVQDGKSHLYSSVDSHNQKPLDINLEDFKVNNLKGGAQGGLPAHNYWDNSAGYIPELVKVLNQSINT